MEEQEQRKHIGSCLSVGELAKRLGVSLPTAHKLVHSTGFPSFRIGRRVLTPEAELETWLKRQMEEKEEI
ncbi:helix-turn-helix domain-containing protein [uncultured Pseudoflavonifractor sp.]|uniref:helix-turn-helix domain-containing protein n=1 Tax=uncultured Pseudoflavonifractor sp. TaxID=1221379 RepID=UPI0025DB605C|nr:helix-turn-helix domain-containing protein [uncultured Pseudoflavonifractor sp.]